MTDTLAFRKVFGLLVPYFNSIVEPEMAALQPTGVSNQTGRFSLDANVLEEIPDVAERLATCGVEAFVFGLSTESFAGGIDLLRTGIESVSARTGLPVFAATFSLHTALRTLGVATVAVVTPFDEESNRNVETVLEGEGFSVAAIEGLDRPSFDVIAKTDNDAIVAAFHRVNTPDVEALVQVGTGLPTLHLVDTLERDLGKPVVTSNSAAYWHALRESGIEDRSDGAGRLFAEH